jgi:hypothetical protein
MLVLLVVTLLVAVIVSEVVVAVTYLQQHVFIDATINLSFWIPKRAGYIKSLMLVFHNHSSTV